MVFFIGRKSPRVLATWQLMTSVELEDRLKTQ